MTKTGKQIKPVQKTFLLRMPVELWKDAKNQALSSDITLHDYILDAISEKVERDEKRK